jgi:putative ATPase
MAQPLADLLRPQKLTEFVGQKEIVGKDKIITKLLSQAKVSKFFPSLIFWGPPGSGKTTLARIIARALKREYFEFSAVFSSIKEIEKIISSKEYPLSPVVVIDEIHRYNKAQQAKLLPFVERGDIILIGATTENPSFEVIAPLLSRTKVILLKRHNEQELKRIAKKGLKKIKAKIEKKAEEFLIESSNGDARILLNTLEIARTISTSPTLKLPDIEQALQKRQLAFDKMGEEYYNVISAFIKSMRASDVDAALYYLARMVTSGQDPLYIARRMVVFASEDVASPTALVVANAVFQACDEIGLPECQENLAAGVVYLSLAKKDRRAYEAYMKALGDVQRYGNLPVPLKIRNFVTKLMEDVGYGEGYKKYDKESYLPEKLKGKEYYQKRLNENNQSNS